MISWELCSSIWCCLWGELSFFMSYWGHHFHESEIANELFYKIDSKGKRKQGPPRQEMPPSFHLWYIRFPDTYYLPNCRQRVKLYRLAKRFEFKELIAAGMFFWEESKCYIYFWFENVCSEEFQMQIFYKHSMLVERLCGHFCIPLEKILF